MNQQTICHVRALRQVITHQNAIKKTIKSIAKECFFRISFAINTVIPNAIFLTKFIVYLFLRLFLFRQLR